MAYMKVASVQNPILARVFAAYDALVERAQQRRIYRETFKLLSALSDRELADLGIHRADIRRVSAEAAGEQTL